MSLRDDALAFIKKYDKPIDAAKALFSAPRALAVYVMTVGVERLRATDRRLKRRDLKAEIQPKYVPGRVTGSIVFSPGTKRKIESLEKRMATEWQIGKFLLFDMTREQVVAHIEQLKAAAKGTLFDVKFYSAIVEPMKPGQVVSEAWTPAAAAKLKSRIRQASEDLQPALM
jgi:hypothetical protein